MLAIGRNSGRTMGPGFRAGARLAAALAIPLLAAGCDAAAPAAAPPGATSASGDRIVPVSGRMALQAALLRAKGGTEIRLAPGDYGALDLSQRKFDGGRLTLVAATAERPHFSTVNLSDAKGVVLAGLDISSPDRPVIAIYNAEDIILAGNVISGATRNQDPWDENGLAVRLRMSTHVTILGNVFEDLKATAFLNRSQGVIFSDNTVRNVREGLNVAAVRDLDISRNYFHAFSPKFQEGEHPDSIQFWTARETEGSHNVRLTENVMLHGICGAIQGIFIRSETTNKPDGPQIRHGNFTIQRNVYYGASKHGVTASSVDGALLENNVVVASPYSETRTKRADAGPRCGGAVQPAILSRAGSTSHIVRRNIAPLMGKTDGQASDNITVGKPPKGVPYTDVFAVRPTGETPPLEAFLTRPGSAAAKKGIGISAVFPFGAPEDFQVALKAALVAHDR